MDSVMGRCGTCKSVLILLIVGGLNWGLIGIGMFLNRDLNVVGMLLGRWPIVEAIVYILVGAAALFELVLGNKCACRRS